METFQGTGVSPGIGLGTARVLRSAAATVVCRNISQDEAPTELERFTEALQHIGEDIRLLLQSFSFKKEERDILNTHLLILEDPALRASVEKDVREELVCLEYAVARYFQQAAQIFGAMQDEYLAQRVADYREVSQRLLGHLRSEGDEFTLDDRQDNILVAEEVPVALLMKIARRKLVGIAVERGSATSHAVIVARSLGVPVVTGIQGVTERVPEGAVCVVDGHSGMVVANPDHHSREVYAQLMASEHQHQEELVKLIGVETRTADGARGHLRMNIENPDEVEHVMHMGGDGIGLLRTEFIFLNRSSLPTEDEQYEIYRTIAEKVHPAPLVIRTVDIGGDKLSNLLSLQKEQNPALGLRGIRLSLAHPDLFRTQIMAILRAAVAGNVHIMLPLIIRLEEVRRSREIIRSCEQELAQRGREYRRGVPLGVMIETPAAAMISGMLARECDFFSIGTNDLIQYTLAVDRASENVADLYDPCHPSVLHLITLTVQNARKYNLPVAVCGEMAAEADFIPFFVGLGLHDLSVSPGLYLIAKEHIMRTRSSDVIDLVLDLLDAESTEETRRRINEWRHKHRY